MHNVAHEESFFGLAILFSSYVGEDLSSVCMCVCVRVCEVCVKVWCKCGKVCVCGCVRCGKVCVVCDGRGGEVERDY